MSPKKSSSARPPSHDHDAPPNEMMIKIIVDIDRAVAAARRGELSSALEVMDYSISRYPDSAALLSTRGGLHFQEASQSRDSSSQHLKSALNDYRRALKLAQKDTADAVIEALEWALLLENLTDPVDDLLDVGDVEEIEKVKQKLEKLIQDSKENKKGVLVDDDILELLIGDNSHLEEIRSLQRRKEMFSWPDDWPSEYKNLKNFQELFKIEIEELIAHFHFDGKKLEVLMEALDFAKKMKSWKSWECCCCGERFLDGDSNLKHIKKAHLETSLSETLPISLLPERVPERISKMVEAEAWKPVDSIAAAKIIENLSPENLDSVEWPYCSNDSKRAEIIDRIHALLRWFISNKYLATSFFRTLRRSAITALKGIIPKPILMLIRVNRPLLLICFLEAGELNGIHDWLEDLAASLALVSAFERRTSVKSVHGFFPRIIFSNDMSSLLFNERQIVGEPEPHDKYDGRAVTSTHNGDEAFPDWLWIEGLTIGEQLMEWTNTREASKILGIVLFNILQREYRLLRQMCQRKYDILRYQKPLLSMYQKVKENEREEEISGYKPQTFHSLLLNREKELAIEMEGDSATDINSFELHMVRGILSEAQADTYMQEKFKNKKLGADRELHNLDAIIMAHTTSMQHTKLKLAMTSFCDYRSIMVPLLKTFVQNKAAIEDRSQKGKAKYSQEYDDEWQVNFAEKLRKHDGVLRNLEERWKKKIAN